jgi:hypothetical protein
LRARPFESTTRVASILPRKLPLTLLARRSAFPLCSAFPLRSLPPSFVAIAAALAFSLAACAVPVEAGLDDAEANRVFYALSHASVDVSKSPDPGAEGKWRIDVAEADVPRALAVMRDEGLPRREAPGVLEALGKGALVPSVPSG